VPDAFKLKGRKTHHMQAKKRARPVRFGKSETGSEKKPAVKSKKPKAPSKLEEKSVKPWPRQSTTTPPQKSEVPDDEKKLEKEASTVESQEVKAEQESDTEATISEQDLSDKAGLDSLSDEQSDEAEKEEDTVSVQITESSFTKLEDDSGKRKSILLYFLIVAFVAFLVGIASMATISYVLNNNTSSNARKSAPSPTSIAAKPTVSQNISSKPVDLSAYTIKVLNGTTTSGEAAKVGKKLSDAGFKIASVGNADKSDFEKTQISVKKKIDSAFISKLKDVLKKTYVLGPDSQAGATAEADVVVTLGSSLSK